MYIFMYCLISSYIGNVIPNLPLRLQFEKICAYKLGIIYIDENVNLLLTIVGHNLKSFR